MSLEPSPTAAAPNNWALIRRLFGLASRYRAHCVEVLALQLVLLTMGIAGLSFTGLGIDYIRHKVQNVPLSPSRFHLALPETWEPWEVLALLAGLILALAIGRALLNYALAVSVNRLV